MAGTLPPEYPYILGEEIRRHRKARGWIRERLRQELRRAGIDVSLHTLATYELGTRSMSVIRLAQIADVLGTCGSEILAATERRARMSSDRLVVDLSILAASTRPELAPAIAWAAIQISSDHEIAELTIDAIQRLADLCQLDLNTMTNALYACRRAA
jgi:transcriptional regulator with XRE-family HTH domain